MLLDCHSWDGFYSLSTQALVTTVGSSQPPGKGEEHFPQLKGLWAGRGLPCSSQPKNQHAPRTGKDNSVPLYLAEVLHSLQGALSLAHLQRRPRLLVNPSDHGNQKMEKM